MQRIYLAQFRTWAFIISVAVLMTSIAGCGGGSGSTPLPSVTPTPMPPPPPTSSQKIEHVVVIVQENRSTDNLFHGLPNADIANSGVNSEGQTVPLTPVALASDYDPFHDHVDFLAMYDGGKMDGADNVRILCNQKATDCPGPNLSVPIRKSFGCGTLLPTGRNVYLC